MALLTIGAFARAARLTPKALRLYDEMGLLTPAAVDAESAYRYYDEAQLGHAHLIGRLRSIGMPLEEIRTVCSLPPVEAAAAVEVFWRQVRADTAARARLTSDLVRHLSGKDKSMSDFLYAATTDPGTTRDDNEDRAYAGPDLVAVADGVRGPFGGAAAEAAIDALKQAAGASLGDLADAVEAGDRAIRALSPADQPATTLTALVRQGSRLALVHVGDTRVYLLRNGGMTLLTQDHTWVQTQVDQGRLSPDEAAGHERRALLVRALGAGDGVEADLALRTALPGDRYLLCSDGLHTVVPRADLQAALVAAAGPQQVVDRLVTAAREAGATDNIACAAYFSAA
ncbi:MerR family transcriptional regulator [Actinoplanes sp. LDG1-06]|uniref:MerR family transcriptional regulator n=1 Tax=Paractinoplanes ovalisporus TaxID=2810368 RepID=A0ABS2A8N5_9ACTN|nr:MerR family transcriptional regulator [Actinoplanes ovalisporus]MBM2616115.1 MerR family transcriptional regulator [Actinoplanes ovalisporus]